MKVQLKQMGLSYDWSREIRTCDKEYFVMNKNFSWSSIMQDWHTKKSPL